MTQNVVLTTEGTQLSPIRVVEWTEIWISTLYTRAVATKSIDKKLFDVALIIVDKLDKNFKELKNIALKVDESNGSALGQDFSIYGMSRTGICYNHGTVNTVSQSGLLQFVGMPPAARYAGFFFNISFYLFIMFFKKKIFFLINN
jgi:hypothetical protein